MKTTYLSGRYRPTSKISCALTFLAMVAIQTFPVQSSWALSKSISSPDSVSSAAVRAQVTKPAIQSALDADESNSLPKADVEEIHTTVALLTSCIILVLLWLLLVNTPPVLSWQLYRQVLNNRLKALPDTDYSRVVLIPASCASGRLNSANGDRHSDVSESLELINGIIPVWRTALVSNDWFGRILNSDSGVIEVSARKQDKPVVYRHRFLIGERSPIWCFLLAWLPFSYMIERSYERDVEGNWSLVFVCPWFRFTWLGTLIPCRGFVLRISSNGLPSVLGFDTAQKLYPHLPLVLPGVAEFYAHAYAVWCGGVRDHLLRRARPLSTFEYAADPSLAGARIESYIGLGDQYTVLLGLDKSQGGALHSVVLFDIRTGEPRLFERSSSSVIYGPLEAIATVNSEFGRGNHRYSAPRLVSSGGKVYWLVTVLAVPHGADEEDGLGLIGHRLVDASTNNVVNLPGGVTAFLDEENIVSHL